MEFIKQNVFYIILAITSGAMLIFDLARNRGAGGLSPTEATLLMNRENALVLDVRDAKEFSEGHIPNARNIPLADLEKRVDEIARFKKKPVVLVCQSGNRSSRASAELAKAGFEKLHNLAGGIALWRKDGHPVVKA